MLKRNARPIKERAFKKRACETSIGCFEHTVQADCGIELPLGSFHDAVIEDLYDDHYLSSVIEERG